jgi:hypothetical protein
MRCAAVSWRNPDGVHRPTDGIHLVWSGPELIELSIGIDTYRVERRQRRPPFYDCDALDSATLDELRARVRLTRRFGGILYRTAPPFRPIALDFLPASPTPGGGGVGRHPGPGPIVPMFGAPTVTLAQFGRDSSGNVPRIEVFTQELTSPVEQIQVSGTATIAFVVAFSAAKAVDVQWSAGPNFVVALQGSEIDTVVVYAIGCTQLSFCPAIPDTKSPWQVIAANLALPVILDATAGWEIAKGVARSRLLPGEALADDALDNLGNLLALALNNPESGVPRPGSRILLMRSSIGEPFDEVSFTEALNLLCLPPWWRRALGFAFSDLEAHQLPGFSLVVGSTYEYRITGVFRADDLTDAIYDFHAVPSGTKLPAAFRIRDLFLRFAEPPRVVLDPLPSNTALAAVSRRGLAIEPAPSVNDWLFPSLFGSSVIIDFPHPVTAVTLEVDANHQFFREPALPGGAPTPLPQSSTIPLTFASPVTRIGLRGTGTLFAIRIPSGQTGIVPLSVQTGTITYGPTTLASPTAFQIRNLQTPPEIVQGPIDETTKVPPRHALGFRLEWLPALDANIDWWPSDLGGDPPSDALAYQIENQPAGDAWFPLQEDDNLIFAANNAPSASPALTWGIDIDEVFAVTHPRAPDASFALRFTDVFPSDTPPRPPAVPGWFYQYRIRVVDPFGRVSDPWTPSDVARLEKHLAPPLPIAPNLPNVDVNGQRIAPSGAYARAIGAGPLLSAADQAILGNHQTAVVINWGWSANERNVDPLATEFRIYTLAKPPDFVPGTITAATHGVRLWTLAFSTDRVLRQNECAGQWITSNDHPFLIDTNTAGSNISIDVEPSLLKDGPVPVVGPASFGRSLAPEHLRPAAWDSRVAVIPIGAADTYQHILFDVLHPSDTLPVDTMWVGVSAADNQPYVPDEIPATAPNGGRPGNEGGMAICTVSARYTGRPPAYARPDPLGDVPEIRTEEPTGRQVIVFLDLPAILNDTASGALQVGEPVVLDRCAVDTLLTITSVSNGTIAMRRNDGSTQTVTFPNPADQQHALDVLGGNRRTSLETRYFLYLTTQFDHRSEIFTRINSRIESFGVVEDLLAPKPQRCFYQVRRGDHAGHIAATGTILPCVVRVPSAAPAKSPEKVRAKYHPPILPFDPGHGPGFPPGSLEIELRAVGDPEIAQLLVFSELTPLPNKPVLGDGELLRVPNRPDLYPNGIRMRAPNGTLLSPVITSLADKVAGDDGWKHAIVEIPVATSGWLRFWCAALTADGIPSPPIGPFTIGVGE